MFCYLKSGCCLSFTFSIQPTISFEGISITLIKYLHLPFDVFLKELFIHCVHLDFAAVVIVVNHVGTKLWRDLNRAIWWLRVSEVQRVFIPTWRWNRTNRKKYSLLKPKGSKGDSKTPHDAMFKDATFQISLIFHTGRENSYSNCDT